MGIAETGRHAADQREGVLPEERVDSIAELKRAELLPESLLNLHYLLLGLGSIGLERRLVLLELAVGRLQRANLLLQLVDVLAFRIELVEQRAIVLGFQLRG